MPVHETAGAGALLVAVASRWDGHDYAGAAWLFAGRDRLAQPAENLASDIGRVMVLGFEIAGEYDSLAV